MRDISDDVVKKYTGNTTGYDKSKATTVSNFFLSLSRNRKLKFLTVLDSKNGREHFFNLTTYKKGQNNYADYQHVIMLLGKLSSVKKIQKRTLTS